MDDGCDDGGDGGDGGDGSGGDGGESPLVMVSGDGDGGGDSDDLEALNARLSRFGVWIGPKNSNMPYFASIWNRPKLSSDACH